MHYILTDEDIVRNANNARRMLESWSKPWQETLEERWIREANERSAKGLEEARARIAARGIDPDSL